MPGSKLKKKKKKTIIFIILSIDYYYTNSAISSRGSLQYNNLQIKLKRKSLFLFK